MHLIKSQKNKTEKRVKRLFKIIIAKSFANNSKEVDIQIQEAKQIKKKKINLHQGML